MPHKPDKPMTDYTPAEMRQIEKERRAEKRLKKYKKQKA